MDGALKHVEIVASFAKICYAHAAMTSRMGSVRTCSIRIIDDTSRLLVSMKDASLRVLKTVEADPALAFPRVDEEGGGGETSIIERPRTAPADVEDLVSFKARTAKHLAEILTRKIRISPAKI